MTETSEAQDNTASGGKMGLLDAVMIGMGAMIGAGIFVLTGLAAEIAGPAAILVFGLNGVVTTFTALSYAELSGTIAKSGGGYAFVHQVLAGPWSFLTGWALGFSYMVAGALYARGFGANMFELLSLYGVEPPQQISVGGVSIDFGVIVLAVVVVGLFALLNVASASATGRAETVVTMIKIAILVVFVGFGLMAASTDAFTPLFPMGAGAVLPAMGLTFIAFEGYDLIATTAEDVEDPRHTIPRAIFISLVATVVIYLFVVYIAIGTLGADELGEAGETGIARAARTFMPTLPLIGSGAAVIAFGAVFSTVSALNAVLYASSRVAFDMGRNGQLPERVGTTSDTRDTPKVAVLLAAAVMVVAVMTAPIELVGNLSSLFFLVSFALVNVAVIKLRRDEPDRDRTFRVPLFPAPPVLGAVLSLALAAFIPLQVWMIGMAWLVLGGGVHLAMRRAGSS
ncbi:APC family permease [soil metagenome]